MDKLAQRSINYKYGRFIAWLSAPVLLVVLPYSFIALLLIPITIGNMFRQFNFHELLTFICVIAVIAMCILFEIYFIRIGYTTISIKKEQQCWIASIAVATLTLLYWAYTCFTNGVDYPYHTVPVLMSAYWLSYIITGIVALRNLKQPVNL